ncbi:unnamed protein product [Staurois parvus]|uniref:Uncharacterized protein n=1 Tax=Staurois parvus TaxID=386267 RepID=A0ABN9DPQ7_9NEOB|nr:unnamed protein product [Staurois parvus]
MGTGGHRWVALVGTGRWHCWAQVGALLGGTAGHWWVAPLGTGERHCWVQVGGLVGGTAGHQSSGH